MDSVEERLARCFSAVFPDLATDAIPKASVNTVDAWDSLNLVTLVAVIEEEFRVTVDLSEIDKLDSYAGILSCVERALGGSS